MPRTRRVPLNEQTAVILDASGNGTTFLGPRIGQRWNVTNAAVLVPNAVKVPQANWYVGGAPTPGNFVDGTFTGNLDATGRTSNFTITSGNYVWAVWTGGDVGATATLSILGIQTYG
jgi:hypothetical protein